MTQPAERSTETAGEPFDSVECAVADISAGRPVVAVDDADRENEGDLIFAASKATPELLAFMIRHTSGVICTALEGGTLDRLRLPLMAPNNTERMRTAYTVSVDSRDGITTGISAHDRATTIRRLADSATEPDELTRPGHVFPLRYAQGGVLRRRGHTEASVDLARLAGLTPAGVICEIVNDDGTMARLPELRRFADTYGLALISIADLITYRQATEKMVRRVAETQLPTRRGTWRAIGYTSGIDGAEHLALVRGELADGENVLVRIHSECLTGDVLGSLRCDCGSQLDEAMGAVAAEGRGVVVYLRGHEGRGIGLLHKLQAYQLQDGGSDTVDANLALGLPADARNYATGAQVLIDLGVRSARLLTNNPNKASGLERWGVRVHGRVALPVSANEHNVRYLRTKRDRMGHDIPELLGGEDDTEACADWMPPTEEDGGGPLTPGVGAQSAIESDGGPDVAEVAAAGGAAHLGRVRTIVKEADERPGKA